ncbi:MAG: UDP-N-acetylmuramate dehydrogenase [Candidatus Berkelbacteria bacterium]|nr:MAG: UDP-N-acetylmuramate dehydrogenase [Candidatus Berkelbacteria bacterium]QQG51514.1 MAG: UDP-N-acetylmuramate dehydrogenase [Candidatus Berkelbacteria bacterium]
MALRLEEDVLLKNYCTFKVGGQAKHFVKVETEADLREALQLVAKEHWPLFILAHGSNVIFPDEGWPGLVILIGIKELKIEGQSLRAGAANMMNELVDASISNGLAGLEWAGGLPGTFGGAIRGNAGAFRGEMKDVIASVRSIETTTGREIERKNDGAMFGYRDSIYKRHSEVIVSAAVELRQGDQAELRATADKWIAFRQDRHPLEFPNVGSIFKNTPIGRVPENWMAHFHDFIKNDPFPIIPTGKIIDDAELKGFKIGQAQVSEKHANYIVNLGGATSKDILGLIDHVKQVVRDKFQIELDVEPEVVSSKE